MRSFLSIFAGFTAAFIAGGITACHGPSEPLPGVPVIIAMPDTVVAINDTVLLRVSIDKSGGVADRFVWIFDNDTQNADTTGENVIAVSWPASDTGMHLVIVRAIDTRQQASTPESIWVDVRLYPPYVPPRKNVVAAARDTVALRVSGSDTNGTILFYVWAFDDAGFADTTGSGTLVTTWDVADTGTVTVRVKAVDDDFIESGECSFTVTIRLFPPHVVAGNDTIVAINDTIILRATGFDSVGTIEFFVWAVGDSLFADTSSGDSISLSWPRPDTGAHIVLVKAVNDRRIESAADSCVVTVRTFPPRLLPPDTCFARIGDTVTVRVSAYDTNGTIAGYVWALDGENFTDTTTGDSVPVIPGVADTGGMRIPVMVFDNDSAESDIDTVILVVLYKVPSLTAPSYETPVSSTQPFVVTVAAGDEDGEIVRYYWDIDGGEWDTTTSDPWWEIRYRGNASERIRAGAMDDDGLTAVDSFLIHFNRPPENVRLFPSDTLFQHRFDSTFQRGFARVSFHAHDPDSLRDSVLKYRFYFGPASEEMVEAYSGTDTVFEMENVDTGLYHWRLTAVDSSGDSAAGSGTLAVMLETGICFVGHSIVTGLCGDEGRGGFRAAILDSLRAETHGFERIRVVGPLATGNMTPPSDDSCLARNSLMAIDILDSLRNHPALSADIWVVMVGVNGYFYNGVERTYTQVLLDSLYRRNRDSFLYVLNGLPLPDTIDGFTDGDIATFRYQLTMFNSMLNNYISSWNASGRNIFLVDAFSALSIGGVFNDSLFFDHLHPNQDGYDILGNAILTKMKEN